MIQNAQKCRYNSAIWALLTRKNWLSVNCKIEHLDKLNEVPYGVKVIQLPPMN